MITTGDLVDKIKAEAPVVRLRSERFGIDAVRYVVEGDIGLAEAALPAYAARRIEIAQAVLADPSSEKQGLLGIERNGRTLRWRPGVRLTYAVVRATFASAAEYEQVVTDMAVATAAWESICGVAFEHVAAKDDDEGLDLGEVTFPVLRRAAGGSTVAMAFFPDDPLPERVVWAFDGYFNAGSGLDPVGVLRHELGHVLGFRHEHIRPSAPSLFSPESLEHTVEITAYDPTSVMHYVAPGIGDPRLRFTEVDRAGARVVYGGPYSEYSFAD